MVSDADCSGEKMKIDISSVGGDVYAMLREGATHAKKNSPLSARRRAIRGLAERKEVPHLNSPASANLRWKAHELPVARRIARRAEEDTRPRRRRPFGRRSGAK